MPALHFATSVVRKLVSAGYVAYFAGGWVRDYLMRHPSDDIDIATNASVEAIQSLFSQTIPVGIAFGIVIVVEDEYHFEVATFRKEAEYVDGRRPTRIEPASPQEDAERRDFTINGMFWDPLGEKLFDYVGGKGDLEKGIVRAIGNPHARFLEDRLRMMRAVRYSTRFNFPIEAATLQAILNHADTLFPAVAMERVWQEFKKMSQFAHFDRGLVLLHKLQLLQVIFPNLKGILIDEIEERVASLNGFPKNSPTISELLELFPYDSLEQLLELCGYLKLSKREKELVVFLHHARKLLEMPSDWLAALEKIEWVHFYANPHAQLAVDIRAAHLSAEQKTSFLREHLVRRRELEAAILRHLSKKPIVDAKRLMQEGVSPGTTMGLLLAQAERIAVNEGIADSGSIIQLLKNSSLWHNK